MERYRVTTHTVVSITEDCYSHACSLLFSSSLTNCSTPDEDESSSVRNHYNLYIEEEYGNDDAEEEDDDMDYRLSKDWDTRWGIDCEYEDYDGVIHYRIVASDFYEAEAKALFNFELLLSLISAFITE